MNDTTKRSPAQRRARKDAIEHEASWRILATAGAHFVLCWDKRAFKKGWQAYKPTITEVLRHLGNAPNTKEEKARAGVVPASLGLVCLDLDAPDKQQDIIDFYAGKDGTMAAADIKTRRGRHLLYQYNGEALGKKAGNKADLIHSTGYVVVWDAPALVQAKRCQARYMPPGILTDERLSFEATPAKTKKPAAARAAVKPTATAPAAALGIMSLGKSFAHLSTRIFFRRGFGPRRPRPNCCGHLSNLTLCSHSFLLG